MINKQTTSSITPTSLPTQPHQIDTETDRYLPDDLAVGGIHHQHQLIARADEQPVVLEVDRHPQSLFTQHDQPVNDDRMLRNVDHRHTILILDVDVHTTHRTINHHSFKLTAEQN